MRRLLLSAAVLLLAAALLIIRWRPGLTEPPPAPAQQTIQPSPANLPHWAYIWQRDWDGGVPDAVTEHGPAFSGLVALAAEVSWRGGSAQVVHVDVDYEALRETSVPIGLALRGGSASGPPRMDDADFAPLQQAADELLSRARAAGLQPCELQLDVDCPESKLERYHTWLMALRARVAPLPLTFTALPTWLRHRAFADLAAAADGVVLQVHSVAPPAKGATMTLCDPHLAHSAVAQLSQIGRPFRIALPTYSYLVGMDSEGKLVGVSAEAPRRSWPAGTIVQELRANPSELAALVRGWTQHPPPHLQGIIWYRLPVADDRLNWRWPTLAAVMAGREPAASLTVRTHRGEEGALDIQLHNSGDADAAPAAVRLTWREAQLIAADGIGGYRPAPISPHELEFAPDPSAPRGTIPPADQRSIGWLRLTTDTEVQGHVISP